MEKVAVFNFDKTKLKGGSVLIEMKWNMPNMPNFKIFIVQSVTDGNGCNTTSQQSWKVVIALMWHRQNKLLQIFPFLQ